MIFNFIGNCVLLILHILHLLHSPQDAIPHLTFSILLLHCCGCFEFPTINISNNTIFKLPFLVSIAACTLLLTTDLTLKLGC